MPEKNVDGDQKVILYESYSTTNNNLCSTTNYRTSKIKRFILKR